MTQYIQGKDGKFAGSVGDGKTDLPTASEVPRAATVGPVSGDPAVDLEMELNAVYARYRDALAQQNANVELTRVWEDPDNGLIRGGEFDEDTYDPRHYVWYSPDNYTDQVDDPERLPFGTPYIEFTEMLPPHSEDAELEYDEAWRKLEYDERGRWAVLIAGVPQHTAAGWLGHAPVDDADAQQRLLDVVRMTSQEALTVAALHAPNLIAQRVRDAQMADDVRSCPWLLNPRERVAFHEVYSALISTYFDADPEVRRGVVKGLVIGVDTAPRGTCSLVANFARRSYREQVETLLPSLGLHQVHDSRLQQQEGLTYWAVRADYLAEAKDGAIDFINEALLHSDDVKGPPAELLRHRVIRLEY